MRTPNQLGRSGPLKPAAPSGVLVRMKKISRVVAFTLAGGLLITPTRPSRKAAPQQVTSVKAVAIKKETVELPKLKEIKAIRGEAVETFMIRAFGVKGGQEFYASESWNLLVDTFTGHRVRRPNRDLIANHGYVLTKDESEASKYSAHYKKLAKERRTSSQKIPKPTRAAQVQPKKIKTQAPVAPKVEKKKTPEKLKVEQKRVPEKKPEVKVAKKKPQIAIPEPQEITVAKKVERKIIPEKKVPEVQKRKAEKPKKPSVTSEALARVEALGFNLVQYLHSIGGTESRHHYKATNEEKGVKLKVDSDKHAIGKYQFTYRTLAAYGISTQEQREAFMKDPKMQERVMVSFTTANIREMLDNPACIELIAQGVKPHEILSAMHHMGPNGVKKAAASAAGGTNVRDEFFARLRQSRDWLRTRTDDYVRTIAKGYDIARGQLDAQTKKATSKKSRQITPTARLQSKTFSTIPQIPMEVERVEPDVHVNSVAAEIAETQSKPKGVPHASNILPFIPSAQVNAILENVQQTEMKDEVREGLIAKLAGVNDVVALYTENIEHYEFEAHIGSLEAREILPGLRDLLATAKKEQTSLRATIEESIMHYELELHRGSKYAAEILPKLYAIAGDDDRSIVAELAA